MFYASYTSSGDLDPSYIRETPPFSKHPPGRISKLLARSAAELERLRLDLSRQSARRIHNSEDAEDLVQETLLIMVYKCPEETLKKGLIPYGRGVLRNKVGNYYRRPLRHTVLEELEIPARKARYREMLVRSPESAIRYAELRSIVDRIVGGLPESQRRPVEMFLAGLRMREIVGLLYPESYQNVLNRFHRGIKKLRQELARLGYEPPRMIRAGTRARALSSAVKGAAS